MIEHTSPGWRASSDAALHIAMPFGGVGIGNPAVCPDGRLRQLRNNRAGALFRQPVLADGGRGSLRESAGALMPECRFGSWKIAELTAAGTAWDADDVELELAAGGTVNRADAAPERADGTITLRPADPIEIPAGRTPTARVRS